MSVFCARNCRFACSFVAVLSLASEGFAQPAMTVLPPPIVPIGTYDTNLDKKFNDSDINPIISAIGTQPTNIHPGSNLPGVQFFTPTVPSSGRWLFDVTGAQIDEMSYLTSGSIVPNAISALDALRLINVKGFGGVFQNRVTKILGGTTTINVIEDVNASGSVTALDALIIINYVNSGGSLFPTFDVVAAQIPTLDVYSATLRYQYYGSTAVNGRPAVRYLDVNGDLQSNLC